MSDDKQWVFCSELWFMDCFSDDEIALLRTTFHDKILNDPARLERVGTYTFTSLFHTCQDAFKVFVHQKVLPTSMSDVAYSWETKAHNLRVLNAIEKCLNRLGNLNSLRSFVENLSLRHSSYDIQPNYYTALTGCIRKAILRELASTKKPLTASNDEAFEDESNSDQFKQSKEYGVWTKFFMALSLALIQFFPKKLTASASLNSTAEEDIQPMGRNRSKSFHNQGLCKCSNNSDKA